MSGSTPASAVEAGEYAAIEATIAETERGRWFLTEHARRARAEDTQTLLSAIARLEHTVLTDRVPVGVEQLRGNLVEMADAISRTKTEIAAISASDREHNHFALASQALDAIVRATEQATSDILGAAEAVQEAAWSLREQGVDADACDGLDRHATAIYTACSFQDLTAQRTARIVYTLRYLEDRVAAMIGIWGRGDDRPPPAPGEAQPRDAAALSPADLCQSDVDRYIAMEVPAATMAALTAQPGSLPLHEDIVFLPVADGEAGDGPAFDVGDLEVAADLPAPVPPAPVPPAPVPPEAKLPDLPALTLAEIEALPAEARIALFA